MNAVDVGRRGFRITGRAAHLTCLFKAREKFVQIPVCQAGLPRK
jgi:hypothetical protein